MNDRRQLSPVGGPDLKVRRPGGMFGGDADPERFRALPQLTGERDDLLVAEGGAFKIEPARTSVANLLAEAAAGPEHT